MHMILQKNKYRELGIGKFLTGCSNLVLVIRYITYNNINVCQSGTCTLREAVIIGSVLTKTSIPVLHSSAALLKLAEMEYSGMEIGMSL